MNLRGERGGGGGGGGLKLVIRVQPYPQWLKWYKTFIRLFGSHDHPLRLLFCTWVFVYIKIYFTIIKVIIIFEYFHRMTMSSVQSWNQKKSRRPKHLSPGILDNTEERSSLKMSRITRKPVFVFFSTLFDTNQAVQRQRMARDSQYEFR